MNKKAVTGILRFVSMLFLLFEKGDEQKNCARYFKICKYAFLIFEKWVIVVVGVCKYPFLIFKIKEFIGIFRICMYAFLT